MLKSRLFFSKRQKIVFTSVVLSLGLLSTQLVPFHLTYRFIVGLAVLSLALSLWALWEGMDVVKAAILLILPTLFTLAVASYYFLLPVRWLTRLPIATAFGLVFYTLLLSQNVFNVAAVRTIPLYRVASTTVFVLTLLTAYLLFNVLFSLNLFFLWNGVGVLLISFPLVLQVLWGIKMDEVDSLILIYTLIIAGVLGEIALSLSFWPISHAMAALVLSTALFITLGTITHYLRDRLSRGVVWEYLAWGIVVFLVALISTSWTG